MVRRIYVEKKQGFDVEAEGLLSVSHGGTGQSLSGLSGALRSYSTIIGTGAAATAAGIGGLYHVIDKTNK